MSTENKNENHTEAVDDEDWKIQAAALKSEGDAAFRSGQWSAAISHYSAALSLDPENATLLSNRSAAYLKNGEKSKALHDAAACVKVGTMGLKGLGRLAAAQQALGRHAAALETWESILQKDSTHGVAKKGVEDCKRAMQQQELEAEQKQQEQQQTKDGDKETEPQSGGAKEEEEDDLDDFFNEVEEVATAVVKEKEAAALPVATDAIKNQRKNLGTAADQIARLLQPHYKFLNLNPFWVLDLDHTAETELVNRRYKALSLLLHPDKNQGDDQAALAYDFVLKAKAKLDDPTKANHTCQLIIQARKLGTKEWHKMEDSDPRKSGSDMETFLQKAVQRMFAQLEQERKEVEERQRKHEARERQQEEEEVQKERDQRTFDKSWKKEERVEKRIGSWRNFQKKKPKL